MRLLHKATVLYTAHSHKCLSTYLTYLTLPLAPQPHVCSFCGLNATQLLHVTQLHKIRKIVTTVHI